MTPQRLWHTFRMAIQKNGYRRANYLREHNLFRHVGKNVHIQGRKLPLYGELISLGDNVRVASGVTFITHSGIHNMLNFNKELYGNFVFQEQIGCIEIGDNVFIGAGSTILSNVRIGSNVIIAAGSIITKDVPSNSVVGGIPAKVIETMDDFMKKITHDPQYPIELAPKKESITSELANFLWDKFDKQRKSL